MKTLITAIAALAVGLVVGIWFLICATVETLVKGRDALKPIDGGEDL
jgi:hypothetical protein